MDSAYQATYAALAARLAAGQLGGEDVTMRSVSEYDEDLIVESCHLAHGVIDFVDFVLPGLFKSLPRVSEGVLTKEGCQRLDEALGPIKVTRELVDAYLNARPAIPLGVWCRQTDGVNVIGPRPTDLEAVEKFKAEMAARNGARVVPLTEYDNLPYFYQQEICNLGDFLYHAAAGAGHAAVEITERVAEDAAPRMH